MKYRFLVLGLRSLISLCLCVSAVEVLAQTETPPAPSASKSVTVPAVKEKKLPNGLTVAVVQKSASPIVTIQLLVKCGASCEDESKAGLANLTADMLTKGTKTRTATQIAEAIEFLGGSISSGAGWNSSFVSVTVTSDKVDQAMAILADVVLNPKFDQKELDLLKSQTLDGLTFNLKQPSFLANYVASKYSFGEHPAGGTPVSLNAITRQDIVKFYSANYQARNAVLMVTGDITQIVAYSKTTKFLAGWKSVKEMRLDRLTRLGSADDNTDRYVPPMVKRLLVVDMPKSGQAAVVFANNIGIGRGYKQYYSASVLNSVLGGGYSSRLNYEIRIKRGLSYGAGSSIGWRTWDANFGTRAQTKNESAPEVAELVLAEIKKLTTSSVANDELVPRKSVLTGGFGRNLETTGGLANALGDLYAFDLPTSELNSYVNKVNAVTDAQIKEFAAQNLLGGDIIIVGDYSIFKDDLAKRFPNIKVEVIKADELDLSKDNLRK
jgi:zinc protease